MTSSGADYHAFVIRARHELREIPGAPAEWRFYIEHMPGGERRHVRSLADLIGFLIEHLPADAVPIPPSAS